MKGISLLPWLLTLKKEPSNDAACFNALQFKKLLKLKNNEFWL